ncbi:MAG: hypothetical protein V5A72_02565, partial [Candidatus Nanohaloarchaea archaeon]
MNRFNSGDYLFLTHLDDYNESLIGKEQVRRLVSDFPGAVYLVNEFPREHEDFENEVSGQELLPEENLLQTKVGLGEPEGVPEGHPETAYFGGFNLHECMANTVDRVVDEYGGGPNYAILEDYTLHGFEVLKDKIDSEEVETVEDLVDVGILEEYE